MNGLNLPTDNLYKFMALSGLAIMIFSAYLHYTKGSEVALAIAQIKGDLVLQQRESALASIALSEALRKRQEKDYLELTRSEERKWAALESKINVLKSSAEIYDWLKIFLTLTFLIGLLISLSGFALWYWRVQRYLDLAVRKT